MHIKLAEWKFQCTALARWKNAVQYSAWWTMMGQDAHWKTKCAAATISSWPRTHNGSGLHRQWQLCNATYETTRYVRGGRPAWLCQGGHSVWEQPTWYWHHTSLVAYNPKHFARISSIFMHRLTIRIGNPHPHPIILRMFIVFSIWSRLQQRWYQMWRTVHTHPGPQNR